MQRRAAANIDGLHSGGDGTLRGFAAFGRCDGQDRELTGKKKYAHNCAPRCSSRSEEISRDALFLKPHTSRFSMPTSPFVRDSSWSPRV